MSQPQIYDLTKTHPFIVSEWHPDNLTPPNRFVGSFKSRILWRCSRGHEWSAILATRTSSRRAGCPYCAGRLPTLDTSLLNTHPKLAQEWADDNLTPIQVTKGSHAKVWWECKQGHKWQAMVKNRVQGRGCPYCAGKIATSNHSLASSFPDLINEWHPDNESKPEDHCPSAAAKILWKCHKGHEWTSRIVDRTTKRQGCPKCWRKTSQAQKDLTESLREVNPNILTDVRGLLGGRFEIDIYFPELKLGIDYCGLYWHDEEHKGKKYHLDKLEAAKKANIRLIQVFENEWLERPTVVLSYIKSIIRQPDMVVGARKCMLDLSPSWNEIDNFIEKEHIQGSVSSGTFNATLKYDNNIIAAIVCRYNYGRNKISLNREKRWELVRYAVKSGYSISGGFMRLWKAFLKKHNPNKVISFSDKRWSQGNLYKRSGFVYAGSTRPSHWYYLNGHGFPLYHKSCFTKAKIAKKLGPLLSQETEAQAMYRFGYHRIWDCGLDRWLWTCPPI